MLVLALVDLRSLLAVADVTAAMSVEALLGTDQAFRDDLQRLRPQPGQAVSAANLTRLLAGSEVVASHRVGDARVQDAYSLRCSPQVHGAARDALAYASGVASRELASAIDNPVVLPDGTVASCGNFHGAPVAHACDFLAIVIADVASIAERRLDRLLDAAPQPRAGAVPRRRPRCRLRADDRPVHRRRARGRLQAPRRAGQRRQHPVVGDAGGPRVDGLGRGPQAATGVGQPASGPRDRARRRRAGARPARSAHRGGRHGRGAGCAAASGLPARDQTASSPPIWPRPTTSCARAPCSTRSSPPSARSPDPRRPLPTSTSYLTSRRPRLDDVRSEQRAQRPPRTSHPRRPRPRRRCEVPAAANVHLVPHIARRRSAGAVRRRLTDDSQLSERSESERASASEACHGARHVTGSRRQALDRPARTGAGVLQTVVQAARAALPELDRVRHEAPAAPVRRARDLVDGGEASPRTRRRGASSAARSASTCDCGEAHAPICDARGRVAKYASLSASATPLDRADDAHLAMQLQPGEQHRRPAGRAASCALLADS